MALVTGTPAGNVDTQEGIYVEGAPNIYFQDYTATPLFNPDGNGFYWGMSGTTAYPAYEIGCPSDVALTENLTINDVRCDTVGAVDTVQQRNYVEFTFTLQSFFPLQVLRHILKGGSAVTEADPVQIMGLGAINNDQRWMVYAPKVYNTDVGDYFVIHIHKAKFVDAWTWNMPFGANWNLTGIRLRGYADTTKPANQQFATIMRSDLSAVPF